MIFKLMGNRVLYWNTHEKDRVKYVTTSLGDFSTLIELFDHRRASFLLLAA